MRRPILAVLVSCATLGAAVAVPGLAQAGTSPTSVTITFIDRPGNDLFRGRVSSPNPNCRENRLVRLFFAQPGDDAFIDRDRSEDNGNWSIDIEAPGASPGRYYVRVTATPNCRAARSQVVTVS
jgi:hypothetical protein